MCVCLFVCPQFSVPIWPLQVRREIAERIKLSQLLLSPQKVISAILLQYLVHIGVCVCRAYVCSANVGKVYVSFHCDFMECVFFYVCVFDVKVYFQGIRIFLQSLKALSSLFTVLLWRIHVWAMYVGYVCDNRHAHSELVKNHRQTDRQMYL